MDSIICNISTMEIVSRMTLTKNITLIILVYTNLRG